jgi:hypothetical protein
MYAASAGGLDSISKITLFIKNPFLKFPRIRAVGIDKNESTDAIVDFQDLIVNTLSLSIKGN